jgi:hypothetical protein
MMRCPKCRCANLYLYERIEEIECREVVDGVLLKERIDHVAGESLGWRAECQDCGHEWAPRRSTIESLGDA